MTLPTPTAPPNWNPDPDLDSTFAEDRMETDPAESGDT